MAFWMQTIEINLRQCSWEDLCLHVVSRFDRDQFNHFIRQYLHVKQTGPVMEYISHFDYLMHQLLAHDPSVNPAFLTGKFIDGLKPEIRAAVVLHRPKDLDIASSLAILQEEVLSGSSSKEYKKLESPNVSIHSSMYQHSKTNDTKSVEHAQSSTGAAKTDDKLANLMSYRRSKGLCFKCGGKWGPQHKCPTSIPLNLVKEI